MTIFFLANGNEVWNVNNKRFKGFRFLIIWDMKNSQHLQLEHGCIFLLLDFINVCTLLGVLTCRHGFIEINKKDQLI